MLLFYNKSQIEYLVQVRDNLRDMVRRLLKDIPNIRIGIMAHGDYCDYSTYVTRYQDLTSDVERLLKFVKTVPSTGGGDAPEVVNL